MFRAKKGKSHFVSATFSSTRSIHGLMVSQTEKGRKKTSFSPVFPFFPRTSVSHKKKSGKKCLNAKRNGNRPCVKEKIFAKKWDIEFWTTLKAKRNAKFKIQYQTFFFSRCREACAPNFFLFFFVSFTFCSHASFPTNEGGSQTHQAERAKELSDMREKIYILIPLLSFFLACQTLKKNLLCRFLFISQTF